MAEFIELCETTEVNTLVIDFKDDHGHITFSTTTEGLAATSRGHIPDMEGLVADLKSRGIYTIARVTCFNDPVYSRLHPELALQTISGAIWTDSSGGSWLNPYQRGSWDYLTAVCLEAVRVGFDEIQLDYVRFPVSGRLSNIYYGPSGPPVSRPEIINEFVSHLREVLAAEGVRLSADVFGIIAISNTDADHLGQDIRLLLNSADALSPMIYPSHFANRRQNGVGSRINGVLFEAPDLDPYGVVYNILISTRNRMDPEREQAIIRPYLQDFTAEYLGPDMHQPYGAQQVREQIQAVYDAGFEEWIIWSNVSRYSMDAFERLDGG